EGLDDGQDGVDLRPPRRPGPTVTRRLLVGQDLLEGQPVDLVLAAGLAFADLVGQEAAADLGPLLHVGVHLSASCESGRWGNPHLPRSQACTIVRLTIPPPTVSRSLRRQHASGAAAAWIPSTGRIPGRSRPPWRTKS